MGTRENGIKALAQLGDIFRMLSMASPWPGFKCGVTENEYQECLDSIYQARIKNTWFTEGNIQSALMGWGEALEEAKLRKWTENLSIVTEPKVIGVVSAGNIPMVALHDVISVLISGHKLLVKLSKDDTDLMLMAIFLLKKFNLDWEESIRVTPMKLLDFDAIIATGSNNTARYFEEYFGGYPNIIRKNRTSVAILEGNESEKELEALADDIFIHFGMGCRNVSKVFLPEGYDLNKVIGALYKYKEAVNHNKYGNNYDYHKALYLMNGDDILENGFMLFKEEKDLHSPLSVLFYEYYADEQAVRKKLNNLSDQIQCVVSRKDIPFGKAQKPELWDYADGIDTLKFLSEI
jgi:hypothetical protein